jgi:hypothetical protein
MPPSLLYALRHRPLGLWLALLLAVFGALAPVVSQALALTRSAGMPMMAICTSNAPPASADAALVSAANSPEEQESAPALAHCPFCLLLADHALPPPPLAGHFLAVPLLPEKPAARFVFVFFTRFALTPPPRGPPAFS